jgi:hypothetical protein
VQPVFRAPQAERREPVNRARIALFRTPAASAFFSPFFLPAASAISFGFPPKSVRKTPTQIRRKSCVKIMCKSCEENAEKLRVFRGFCCAKGCG